MLVMMAIALGLWTFVLYLVTYILKRLLSNFVSNLWFSILFFIRSVSDPIRKQYQQINNNIEDNITTIKQDLPIAAFCAALPFYWIIRLFEIVIVSIFRIFYAVSVIGSIILLALIIFAIISKYNVMDILLISITTLTMGTFLLQASRHLTVMARLLINPSLTYEISDRGIIKIQ